MFWQELPFEWLWPFLLSDFFCFYKQKPDVDSGEVRLRVDDQDFGIVTTLPPGFARPVFPFFYDLNPGDKFEILT